MSEDLRALDFATEVFHYGVDAFVLLAYGIGYVIFFPIFPVVWLGAEVFFWLGKE